VLLTSKKNSAPYLSRGRDELAVLDSFGCNQFSRDLMDSCSGASHDDYLQAVMLIEVDVQARIDRYVGLVLHVSEQITETMRPVIIDQADHPDNVSFPFYHLFLNQVVADQISYGLGPVGVVQFGDAAVKRPQQVFLQRDAET
jgi:hypothetical protein